MKRDAPEDFTHRNRVGLHGACLVFVAPSLIPNAGDGVFTTIALLPGDVLFVYSGRLLYQGEGTAYILTPEEEDYSIELSRDWVLVGSPTLSDGDGFGAKINSGYPFFRSNVKFVVNQDCDCSLHT